MTSIDVTINMDAQTKKKFSILVKALRQELGYSQEKMARELGLRSQSTISEWERANFRSTPEWSSIQALADLKNVSLDNLRIELGLQERQQYDLNQIKTGIKQANLQDCIELLKLLTNRIEALNPKKESIGAALKAYMQREGKTQWDIIEMLDNIDFPNAQSRVTAILKGDSAYEEELAAIGTILFEEDINKHPLHVLIERFGVKKTPVKTRGFQSKTPGEAR